MEKRYIINLTPVERASLKALTTRGRVSALKLQRARILLLADEGLTDSEIADQLDVARTTAEDVRKRCCLTGIEASLDRKKQDGPSRARKLDGAAEARLVQIACSAPPDGRGGWTLRLLADKLVELEVVDTIGITTVYRQLKKTNSSHGR
jgi:transposase